MRANVFGTSAAAALLALSACASGPLTPEQLCAGNATQAEVQHLLEVAQVKEGSREILKRTKLELLDAAVASYDDNTKMATCTASVTLHAPAGYQIKAPDIQGQNFHSSFQTVRRMNYVVQPAADGSGLLFNFTELTGFLNGGAYGGLVGVISDAEVTAQLAQQAENARRVQDQIAVEEAKRAAFRDALPAAKGGSFNPSIPISPPSQSDRDVLLERLSGPLPD